MHRSHTELQHDHAFGTDNRSAERRIGIVVAINALTMAAEIIAGTVYGSMALVADGWHMGTHMFALGITLAAYALARRHMRDTRFAFGTWKIEILGGYTSAVLLGVVGLSMCYASVERLIKPVAIQYDHALLVAVIGLAVNIAGALILGIGNGGDHGHDHGHHHDHPHTHDHDLNMRAAYIHVVTDALTSVLAIGALIVAKYFSWNFFDPVAGMVGAVLILRWTAGLLGACGSILLDREDGAALTAEVRSVIESDGTSKVSDLHVWQIARGKYACIITLVTNKDSFTIADFKKRLESRKEIVHATIELHYFS
ncbi:MAG: CDF family Co(II)/Ni(II) efflux transporter DmeF [Chitinispirillaceae bacterium]|nr:CDF family Co(II)/Ni(II) efflux transporter DmeF [Chitinispirillaceae bacterium]